MNYPISEVIDRLSIALLKNHRAFADNSNEIVAYKEAITDYEFKQETYIGSYATAYMNKLYDINGEIWDLESDIRAGKENQLGLEEVGRRALKIRDLNKQRVAIKNEIVDRFGEGFKDIKVNHASE